ncbi:hypothetical protein UPYG_G00164910 [Umbra pygmaea]|uniref:VWFA domain-containing protein n=1 Tax=Umbra pygmaea TaxID=75934 RepID=A0ABD0WSB1_UMBPY
MSLQIKTIATDINAAVLKGTDMLNRHPREGTASILILLTDGDPTSGVTNPEQIHKNVKEAIDSKFPLYCLGFGMDVKFEFLEKMALENNGVGRRIYEDSDAAQQLQGFYEEVATPLLKDVQMVYMGGSNLTQTNFSQYYNGSEIVVAGQITDNNIAEFTAEVIAISKTNKVKYSETTKSEEPIKASSDSNIQRLWAYLTVKQLLDKEVKSSGDEKEKVKKEALDLCLKYGFVTPLTSMVVTKPQGEDSQVVHKPKEGETPRESMLDTQASRAHASRVNTYSQVAHKPKEGEKPSGSMLDTQASREQARRLNIGRFFLNQVKSSRGNAITGAIQHILEPRGFFFSGRTSHSEESLYYESPVSSPGLTREEDRHNALEIIVGSLRC